MAAESNSVSASDPLSAWTNAAAGPSSAPIIRPDATLLDLVELATSQLPVADLMLRIPECLATIIGCRYCGVATRPGDDDEVFLRMSRRNESGVWSVWNQISKKGDNGGAVTEYVRTQAARMVVHDWKNAPFRDICLEQKGIASAIVFPVGFAGVNFGTLGVYHDARRTFGADEIRYVESAASLLARALEDDRLDRRFVTAVTMHIAERDISNSALAVLSRDMRPIQINRAFETISGFTLDEIGDRTFVGALTDAGDSAAITAVLRQLAPGEPPQSLECGLLNKHGVRRRMAWSFMAVQLPENEVLYLASGIDVTERHEAVQRAERAESKAKASLESLLTLKSAVEAGDIVQIRHVMYDVARTADGGQKTGDAENLLSPANRRAHERGVFRTIQRIAPYVSGQVPKANAFFDVSCRDLSAGGVSFFMAHRPTAKQYIIALGSPESAILMSIEVCNCRLVEEQGNPQYLVGCKFLERVEVKG